MVVEFEPSIGTAMKKLRRALGDDAAPRATSRRCRAAGTDGSRR